MQLYRTHHDEWPLQLGSRGTRTHRTNPSSSTNAALRHLLPAGASLYNALCCERLLVRQLKLQALWAQLAGKQGARRLHVIRGSCMGDYKWW